MKFIDLKDLGGLIRISEICRISNIKKDSTLEDSPGGPDYVNGPEYYEIELITGTVIKVDQTNIPRDKLIENLSFHIAIIQFIDREGK